MRRRIGSLFLLALGWQCFAGCGGNAAVARETRDCRSDSECVLVPLACCGPCEPYGTSDVAAINRDFVFDYRAHLCPSDIYCPACMPSDAQAATGKFLRAECRAGQCATVDVRTTPITECATSADCELRDGVDCCPDCDGRGWVAVSKNAEFCSGESVPCPKCIAQPSLSMGAGCNVSTGRCEYDKRR